MLVICPSRKTHGGRRRRRRRRRHDCKHFLGVHQLGGNEPPEEQSTHDAPTPLVKGVDNQASQINLLRLKHHPKILLRLKSFLSSPRHDCNQLYHTQRCKLGDIFFFFLFLLLPLLLLLLLLPLTVEKRWQLGGHFCLFLRRSQNAAAAGDRILAWWRLRQLVGLQQKQVCGWMDGSWMDEWMDGWMLLVGRNNAHHLKAQNSKIFKKEGSKEGRNVSTQMLLLEFPP